MNKIIIEEKNGSWVASWSDKEGVATGRSPNDALKMLLKTDEMITRKVEGCEKIEEEISKYKRYKIPFSVLLIDVDFFKK